MVQSTGYKLVLYKSVQCFFYSKSNCITKNNTKTHRTSGVLIKKKKVQFILTNLILKENQTKWQNKDEVLQPKMIEMGVGVCVCVWERERERERELKIEPAALQL